MKTPEQIAVETLDGYDRWDDLTVGDLELGMNTDRSVTVHKLVINAIKADRAQRDIYELIAEALDDRVANDLYDDEQTARTKKAAARFRGEDGGWEDDLWNKYIGPMLDEIEGL